MTSADTSGAAANEATDGEDEASASGGKTAGVLDKAIARIHQLAAARGTTQLCV